MAFTLGVGGAVRVGLNYAERNGYDRAVVIDADGQHDPAGISALLDALDRGAAMAVGSRFVAGEGDYPVGRTRRQAMRFLGAIVRVLTGQQYSDVTSGFRALDRPVIELLAREYPVEYLADTVEALLIVRYAGFRVDEVPVKMRPRSAGVPSTAPVPAPRQLFAAAHRHPRFGVPPRPTPKGRSMIDLQSGSLSGRAHILIVVATAIIAFYIFRLVRASAPQQVRPALVRDRVVDAAVGRGAGRAQYHLRVARSALSPAILLLFAVGFLFLVVVHFSWELSRLENRTRSLAEELALLRAGLDNTASAPTDGK